MIENQEIIPEETQQEVHEENKLEVNLRQMREAREEDAKRFAELSEKHERMARELEELRSRPKQEPEDDSNDDDFVEWRDLKEHKKRMNEMEKDLKKQQQVNANYLAITRLISENADYQAVMTQENIDKLEKEYPELAHSLSTNQEPYSQRKSIYQAIKKFGIFQEKTYEKEKEAIQENAAKPLPAAAIGGKANSAAISTAHLFASNGKLTEEMKEKIRRQNDMYRKRI
jgi:hypothetical protein